METIAPILSAGISIYMLAGASSFGYALLRTGWPKIRSLDQEYKKGWSLLVGTAASGIILVSSYGATALGVQGYSVPELVVFNSCTVFVLSYAALSIKRKYFGTKKMRIAVPKRAIAASIVAKNAVGMFPENYFATPVIAAVEPAASIAPQEQIAPIDIENFPAEPAAEPEKEIAHEQTQDEKEIMKMLKEEGENPTQKKDEKKLQPSGQKDGIVSEPEMSRKRLLEKPKPGQERTGTEFAVPQRPVKESKPLFNFGEIFGKKTKLEQLLAAKNIPAPAATKIVQPQEPLGKTPTQIRTKMAQELLLQKELPAPQKKEPRPFFSFSFGNKIQPAKPRQTPLPVKPTPVVKDLNKIREQRAKMREAVKMHVTQKSAEKNAASDVLQNAPMQDKKDIFSGFANVIKMREKHPAKTEEEKILETIEMRKKLAQIEPGKPLAQQLKTASPKPVPVQMPMQNATKNWQTQDLRREDRYTARESVKETDKVIAALERTEKEKRTSSAMTRTDIEKQENITKQFIRETLKENLGYNQGGGQLSKFVETKPAPLPKSAMLLRQLLREKG